jgi:hypothetical protein
MMANAMIIDIDHQNADLAVRKGSSLSREPGNEAA